MKTVPLSADADGLAVPCKDDVDIELRA